MVRDALGAERAARPFGRKLQIVCGDQVTCEIDAHHDEAHVTAVLPRDSCLYRTNLRADEEAVVANLTLDAGDAGARAGAGLLYDRSVSCGCRLRRHPRHAGTE